MAPELGESARRRAAEVVALYAGLSPRARRAVWLLLALEVVLIIAVQRDIGRQPPDAIRGPKGLWRAIATQNVVGPAAYYLFGRRR